jgi:magnesium transporter
MITIYKSIDEKIVTVDEISEGCWVDVLCPSEQEIESLVARLSVDDDYIRAALDEEERPRIENKDAGEALILIDMPYDEISGQSRVYATIPLGIIVTPVCVVTVSLKETSVLSIFKDNKIKTFYTFKKSRFILQVLYRNATIYLQNLRQIDKQCAVVENELHKSMRNKELIHLLDLNKSLVYFSTSLRSNQLVLDKLTRYTLFTKYEEDKELLEDTMVESRQAIEMTKIYSDILSGTADAFASIISNNLNVVMKVLASITVVMAIPTIISSLFGMNVPVPFSGNNSAFLIITAFSIGSCIVAAIFMSKRNLF